MVLHYALQELKRLGRDGRRCLLLLAPILATLVCLWVYSQRTIRELPIGIVDQDHSALSRSLERSLEATPQLRLEPYANREELLAAMRRGEIRGGVFLPSGLGEAVKEGRTASVSVWRDASLPVVSNQIYAACAAVVQTENARQAVGRLAVAGLALHQAKEMAMPLRLDSRLPENPFLDYSRYMAPGLITSFLQMCLMLAGGSMLPSGWRRSMHPRRELLGRSLPWLLGLGSIAASALLWLVHATGYPLWAVPASLLLGALLMVASLLCGAAYRRLVDDPLKSAQTLLAFNTPAFLLSGYAFPEWAFPRILELVTRPLPFSLFVDAWRAVSGGPTERGWVGLLGLSAYALVPLVGILWPRKVAVDTSPEPVHYPADPQRYSPLWELKHALTTPGLSLLFAVAVPLYLIVYGSLYSQKEELELPLGVTGGNSSALARELTRNLDAHRRLDVFSMHASAAREAMDKGWVRGVLHIPDQLDSRVRSSWATAIPLEVHADRLLPAGDIQRAVSEVLSFQGSRIAAQVFVAKGFAPSAAMEKASPIVMDDHPAFNPLETYGDYMLPFLGALLLHQLLLVSIAFSTTRRGPSWQRGLVYTAWFCVWMGLWLLPGLYFFGVPQAPDWAGVALAVVLGFGAVAALGMMAGSVLEHKLSVLQLLAFTSYPFFFLSGASWPREMMPDAARWVGNLVPLQPLSQALNRSFRMGASLRDIYPELIHLAILLVVYAILAKVLRSIFVRYYNEPQG